MTDESPSELDRILSVLRLQNFGELADAIASAVDSTVRKLEEKFEVERSTLLRTLEEHDQSFEAKLAEVNLKMERESATLGRRMDELHRLFRGGRALSSGQPALARGLRGSVDDFETHPSRERFDLGGRLDSVDSFHAARRRAAPPPSRTLPGPEDTMHFSIIPPYTDVAITNLPPEVYQPAFDRFLRSHLGAGHCIDSVIIADRDICLVTFFTPAAALKAVTEIDGFEFQPDPDSPLPGDRRICLFPTPKQQLDASSQSVVVRDLPSNGDWHPYDLKRAFGPDLIGCIAQIEPWKTNPSCANVYFLVDEAVDFAVVRGPITVVVGPMDDRTTVICPVEENFGRARRRRRRRRQLVNGNDVRRVQEEEIEEEEEGEEVSHRRRRQARLPVANDRQVAIIPGSDPISVTPSSNLNSNSNVNRIPARPSEDELAAKYEEQLVTLAQMGFDNLKVNLDLLYRYNGNVQRAVGRILEM